MNVHVLFQQDEFDDDPVPIKGFTNRKTAEAKRKELLEMLRIDDDDECEFFIVTIPLVKERQP